MIRAATPEDAHAIAELEVRAWRWAYVDIVAEPDMPTVAEREQRWRERSVEGASVWEADGLIAGVVQVGPRDDEPGTGALRGLYVEPAAQGAGVGGALHDHAVEELRRAGFPEAILWTFAANGHAREFYARRAWAPDGATAVWLGIPSVRYRRDLRPH